MLIKVTLIIRNKKDRFRLIKLLIWMLNNRKYLIRLLKMLLTRLYKDIMALFLLMGKLGQVRLLL
jgi:hypothetical protein